eukprot:3296883-Rhodomonas_salina.1
MSEVRGRGCVWRGERVSGGYGGGRSNEEVSSDALSMHGYGCPSLASSSRSLPPLSPLHPPCAVTLQSHTAHAIHRGVSRRCTCGAEWGW